MELLALLISIFSLVVISRIYLQLKIEKKRNRILQSFIAWIMRSISDYQSQTDNVSPEYIPEVNKKLPISYNKLLESVQYEFWKDFWINPYGEWLKKDRWLFDDTNYGNDWFNFIYLDFFDKASIQWNSGELMRPEDKNLLNEDVIITEENLMELEGEIWMYRDLLSWNLDDSKYTTENIDRKIAMIFNHIKSEHLDNLKEAILERK